MPSNLTKGPADKYAGYSQSFESASMIASPAIAAVLYSMFPLKAILMLDVLGAFLQWVPWLALFPWGIWGRTDRQDKGQSPGP